MTQILWKSEMIKIYGKSLIQPRLTAFYNDGFHQSYDYSGLKMDPEKWIPILVEIKEKISKISEVKFNGVVLNRYRNGQDYIGWHSDDEKSLGNNPTIISISFGAERRFLLRRKDNKKEKIEINLRNGGLLVMAGEIQHYWQHHVPRALKVNKERINLTFREFKR